VVQLVGYPSDSLQVGRNSGRSISPLTSEIPGKVSRRDGLFRLCEKLLLTQRGFLKLLNFLNPRDDLRLDRGRR
jgi:hypothetical protein